MSNELAAINPNYRAGFSRAVDVFNRIRSFDDIETYLLRGAGLAANTYKNYMVAVRQFYHFTGGLNPFQVEPGHIESFYDHVSTHQDLDTAYYRVMGLKRFFKTVSDMFPGWVSPFTIMQEPLLRKLHRRRRKKSTREALTATEIKRLLEWLSGLEDPKGRLCYAAVFMLVTSGLRASELCQLRWEDIELFDLRYVAHFIEKGGDPAEQELYEPAVKACRIQQPESGFIFRRLDGSGRALDPHALWYIISKICPRAQELGIIHQSRRVTWSPHLFRRSYATILYKAGMKIKAVSQKTRHASIDVLLNHYIDDRQAAAPLLAEALA